ncbi:unnamed protein product [Triticum turgidum subsp. durum]|uniref:Cytochrome P450 n=1 Tax=Triticum turgidum subsp. durum TaxID=4567 RepID=A0A9R1NGT4_TRITD|nr:unnamed protein product [Triticum turgidum subsp. durum]
MPVWSRRFGRGMQQQVQQISMDQLVVLLALLLCGLLAVLRRGRAPPPPPSLAMHKIIDPAVAHRALVDNADAFSNRPPARLHVALAGRRGGQRNENLNSVAHGPHWRALRDDEMVQLISEFLGAGTGTAVATLEWALAHLVDKPEMQEKLRGEVDNGEVSRAGAGMPYLHAVVLETLRMHPPLPVIPRHVHADAVGVLAGGMDVPPPACDFYVNFSAGDIGRDSKIWKDPDEFLPERFLTGGDGEGIGPLPGPKQIRMMPFGAGHRFCPGVGMAMVNMKCFLAALVREFEWAPPTGTIAIDLTELDSFFKMSCREQRRMLDVRGGRAHFSEALMATLLRLDAVPGHDPVGGIHRGGGEEE